MCVCVRSSAALWDTQVHRWSAVTPAERLLASGASPCCDSILLSPRRPDRSVTFPQIRLLPGEIQERLKERLLSSFTRSKVNL